MKIDGARPRLLALIGALTIGLAALVAVRVWFPKAFAIALAVGALVGAGIVIYEVRLTKRIAQAEFIRSLNGSFTSDHNIDVLWRKILLDEPITVNDRHLMSSYLTFFETLYMLIGRDVLEFELIDNLFRNRFFRAIGHPAILSAALIAHGSAFLNIHDLIRDWHAYLREKNQSIPDGYFAYRRAVLARQDLEFVELTSKDVDELLQLSDRVITQLDNPDVLRNNTREMFVDCLAIGAVVGFRHGTQLVAAGILVDAGDGDESIAHYVRGADPTTSVNLKLVMVERDWRAHGIGSFLAESLEKRASELDKSTVLCTVHPDNDASRSLFTGLGYRRRARATTTYGRRLVFGRDLPVKRHW
jgi:ribosomal protein S18 acetylase RimI-like enzyme/xanthosine utilization system XapX-like protein